MYLPVIALVGAVNVGKSTLFNSLTKQRNSLVHHIAGTSRDYIKIKVEFGSYSANLIDTPGWVFRPKGELEKQLCIVSRSQWQQADLVVFVYDALNGLSSTEEECAKLLRRDNCNVILVANKCETAKAKPGIIEGSKLGFKERVNISSAHRQGINDLEESIEIKLKSIISKLETKKVLESKSTRKSPKILGITLIGKPNSGKSTLINRIIGEERMLTGPMPGLTRDAISHEAYIGSRLWKLMDTPGLRRRANTTAQLDKLSASKTINSIDSADIVLLVIDLTLGPSKQDSLLAARSVKEGKGLIIVLNKSDLLTSEKVKFLLKDIRETWIDRIEGISGIPIITLSAISGIGLERLYDLINNQVKKWQTNISTGPLNRWLQEVQENHPPPRTEFSRPRLKYITQCDTSPPYFIIFSSMETSIPTSYMRYLGNQMRKTFKLSGIPMNFIVRGSKNPYK